MMEKRVYGVLGVKSIMSNWNADFNGQPKTISSGECYGSDKAFKYPMKKLWENKGLKVLYIKSFKEKTDKKKEEVKIVPKSLKERYEELFNIEDLKKEKDSKTVLTNLFSATDVKNFGATFAEEGNNFGITGAVQIGQGFNKYDDSIAEEQQILSPFAIGDASQSTLGTKIVSDEAHYFYPLTINPLVYKPYIDMGITNGYTNEDYNLFKETALVCATSFNTNSKIGCENEFAIFVETEKELYLPNLAEYITFKKTEDLDIIELGLGELLNSLEDRILSVEIYYNPYKTQIKSNINNYKAFNIFTKEEIK